jgi:hypothetical protein
MRFVFSLLKLTIVVLINGSELVFDSRTIYS